MKKAVLLALAGLCLVLFTTSCEQSALEKGNSLFANKNFNEAIEAYSLYLVDHPKDADAFFNRARAYEEQGMLKEALEDYEKASGINPYEYRFELGSGVTSIKLENYNQALINLNQAIELNPNAPDAYVYKGMVLIRQGKVDKALEHYNTAIRYDNNYAAAYYHRGVLKALSKKGGACEDLRKAQSLGYDRANDAINKYCS